MCSEHPHVDEAAFQDQAGLTQPMERLPHEVRVAIFRDALLMHVLQRQLRRIRGRARPIFYVWMKIVYYERQWPGSTELCRPGPPVVWD